MTQVNSDMLLICFSHVLRSLSARERWRKSREDPENEVGGGRGEKTPGARFSKVPVTYHPDLPGPISVFGDKFF